LDLSAAAACSRLSPANAKTGRSRGVRINYPAARVTACSRVLALSKKVRRFESARLVCPAGGTSSSRTDRAVWVVRPGLGAAPKASPHPSVIAVAGSGGASDTRKRATRLLSAALRACLMAGPAWRSFSEPRPNGCDCGSRIGGCYRKAQTHSYRQRHPSRAQRLGNTTSSGLACPCRRASRPVAATARRAKGVWQAAASCGMNGPRDRCRAEVVATTHAYG
jgi:hypothetical protein